MSYLSTLRETLAARLSALPEAEREALIAFVLEEVLTSYRNGQRASDGKRPPRKDDGRAAAGNHVGRPASR